MSTAKVANISNLAGTKSLTTDQIIDRASCQAWVNFDGTTNVGGNCTVRASFNVSSITDLGTGSFRMNFAVAMADANYAVIGTSTSVVGTAITTVVSTFRRDTDTRVANLTTSTTFCTCNTQNSTALDAIDVNVAVFR
jgi:hypothetical protein